jgi:hypothetical protein
MPEFLYGKNPDSGTYYKAIIHEFGHYGMYLYDEYEDINGNSYGHDIWGRSKGPKSIMNDETATSEMSSQHTYNSWNPPSGFDTTEQYGQDEESCWETFVEKYLSKIWFDLDYNGVRDTDYKYDYSPVGGPGTLVDGGYTSFEIYNT